MTKTTRDVTVPFPSGATAMQLTIPKGTRAKHVPHNGGLATPDYAVASVDDVVAAGSDRFTAEHYWCWLPLDAISEENP